jgi:hypothetical protein
MPEDTDSSGATPRQVIDYDAFLSHASEDKAWCERLAERLRDEGVRVWFDGWELQPGDHLLVRVNDGLRRSRKLIARLGKHLGHPQCPALGERLVQKELRRTLLKCKLHTDQSLFDKAYR